MEPSNQTPSASKKAKKNFCDVPDCQEEMNYLPFRCKYCGGTFCKQHRLPENHNCEFSMQTSTSSPSQTHSSTETYSSAISPESEYLYDPNNDIPDVYNDDYDSSSSYEEELDRDMRNYVKKQEKSKRKKRRKRRARSREVSGVRVEHRTPFISQTNKPLATYWILGLNLAFFIISSILISINGNNWVYFLVSLPFLRAGWYLSLILSMVTTTSIFSILIFVIMFFGIGKQLEMRYGSKFLLALYFGGTVIGTLVVLVAQFFGILLNLSFLYTPTTTQWCGIMALLSFIIHLAGMDREMRFMIYFIPVQMKGRTMLYLLIGINLLTVIGGFLLGILNTGFGGAVASSLGQIAAIFVGRYLFDKYGHQISYRFY